MLSRWLPRPYPQPAQNAQNAPAPIDPAQWEKDQPGLPKAPAAPAALPAVGQQAAGLRQRSASLPPPRGRNAAQPLAAMAMAAARPAGRPAAGPRTSLCSRAVRCLTLASAGLLGILTLKLLASTPYPDHLPAAQRTWPEAEPGGVTHHRETLADAWRIDEEAHTALSMPLPCSLEDTPAAPAGDLRHTPTLTEVMDSIFTERNRLKALALVASMAGDQAAGLPIDAVERMVSSFRASRRWREPDATREFMEAMILPFDNICISNAHLEQLLKVWDWTYGDVSGQLIDEGSDLGWTLTDSIARPLARHLGGVDMADSHKAILIRAVCKEPTGIPKPNGDDRILMAHASRVGEALAEVLIQLNTVRHPWPDHVRWVEANVLAYLHYPLTQPYTDARWKPAIFRALQDQGTNPRVTALIPAHRWRATLLDAVNRYLLLSRDGKQLQLYPSIGEALAALHQQGLIIIRDPSKDPWTPAKKTTRPDDAQSRIDAIEVPIKTKIERRQADF